MSSLVAILVRGGIAVIASYLFVILFLFFQQKNYIYFPDYQDFESCPGFAQSQKINWHGTRAYYTKVTNRLLVFYHGNAGSACDRAFLEETFKQLGYSTLFVEYAGYSNDHRKPSRTLLLADAEQINEFLKTLSYSELVLAGESLGSALALYHSSLLAADKLLLISAFDRLSNVAKRHYPWFPVSLLLREEYDTSQWISKAKSLLLIHGSKDEIIPLALGEALFQKIPVASKKFVAVPGAGHNDLYEFERTFQAIFNFLGPLR